MLPTTVFPNFPPGGQVDDENNQKAIKALKNAKEYTIVDEEDALHQESILSGYLNLIESKLLFILIEYNLKYLFLLIR